MDSTETNANQSRSNNAGGLISLLLVLVSLAVIVWAGYGIWTSNSLQTDGTAATGGTAAGAFPAGVPGAAQPADAPTNGGANSAANAAPGNAPASDTANAADAPAANAPAVDGAAPGSAAAIGRGAPISGTLPITGTFPMSRTLGMTDTVRGPGAAMGQRNRPADGENAGAFAPPSGERPAAPPAADTASPAAAAPAVPETAPVAASTTPSTVSTTSTVEELTAVVGAKGVQLWNDEDGTLVEAVDPGALLTATGRSEDGAWLYVQNGDADGWIDGTQIVAFGAGRLPVIAMTTEPQADTVSDESTSRTANTDAAEEDAADTGAVDTDEADEEATASAPRQEEERVDVASAAADDTSRDDTSSAEDAAAALDAAQADAEPEPDLAAEAVAVGAIIMPEDARLNVRAGPGEEYRVIAKAFDGEAYGVLARSADGAWVQLVMPNVEGDFGWVAAAYVDVDEPFNELPVSDAVSDAPYYQQADAGGGASVQPVVLGTGGNASQATGEQSSSTATGVTGLSGTLVFQESNGGLFHAYDFETGQTWPLTTGLDPAISPDGQTVAFTRDGGENGIYLIDIDGSNERLIFSGRAGLRSPKWSPDGQWIVFSRADEYDECYEMGRNCQTLDDLNGRISAEDLENFSTSKEYKYQLAAVDPNGENYHDIASLDSARAPDWVDAGITYQSAAGIQITQDEHAAHSELVTFNYLKPFYHDPDWSPDGSRIAFMSKEGSHWEIFTVNPDGSDMTALTRPSTTLAGVLPSNAAPAWSPDGEHIVFVSNRTDAGNAGPWRVWIMDADGSNQQPLPIPFTIDYGFGDDQAVSWAP